MVCLEKTGSRLSSMIFLGQVQANNRDGAGDDGNGSEEDNDGAAPCASQGVADGPFAAVDGEQTGPHSADGSGSDSDSNAPTLGASC